MANADMNRLMDHARIRLPGALDAAIQMELFSALREFFTSSNCWYEDIDFTALPTDVEYFADPDAFTYDLVPTEGSITRLMFVRDDEGRRISATMPTPGLLVLGYAPDETKTYTARVALTVVDPVTREGYPQFPDWVLQKYGNEILDGVLGRMMSQIAKPYSNPTMALMHLRKFKQTISKAKVEASVGNVYRGQNWLYPQTFASRKRGII